MHGNQKGPRLYASGVVSILHNNKPISFHTTPKQDIALKLKLLMKPEITIEKMPLN